jgi:hypothetical protein
MPKVTWCSLNWGVTLCDACCAEHRSLGANISKVRSLGLDEIDPFQRALIEAIGSEKANSVLEAMRETPGIDPSATDSQRAYFIQMKYKNRAFARTADEVDIFKAIQEQNLMEVYSVIAAGKLQMTGFTPLHAAAVVGNPLIMHLICLNVPTVNVLDENGWSPLCYAVYFERRGMVNILISYGGDEITEGINPFFVARSRGNEHMMAKLAYLVRSEEREVEGNVIGEPAHLEIRPQEFVFADFVCDPSVYLTARIQDSPALGNWGQLDSAVNLLKHRLASQVAKKSSGDSE